MMFAKMYTTEEVSETKLLMRPHLKHRLTKWTVMGTGWGIFFFFLFYCFVVKVVSHDNERFCFLKMKYFVNQRSRPDKVTQWRGFKEMTVQLKKNGLKGSKNNKLTAQDGKQGVKETSSHRSK